MKADVVEKLCSALGAPGAAADVLLAQEQPAAYFEKFRARMAERGIATPSDTSGASLRLIALVDALDACGAVRTVNRHFSLDEVADFVTAMVRRAKLARGYRFVAADRPESCIGDSIDEVGASLRKKGVWLFSIVLPWDEYPLFVADEKRAIDIGELARGATVELRAWGDVPRPPPPRPARRSAKWLTTVSLPDDTDGRPYLVDPFVAVATEARDTHWYDLREPTKPPRVERASVVHTVCRARDGAWLVAFGDGPRWDRKSARFLRVGDDPRSPARRMLSLPPLEDEGALRVGWLGDHVAALEHCSPVEPKPLNPRVWLEAGGVWRVLPGAPTFDDFPKWWPPRGFARLDDGRDVVVFGRDVYEVRGGRLARVDAAPPTVKPPRGSALRLAYGDQISKGPGDTVVYWDADDRKTLVEVIGKGGLRVRVPIDAFGRAVPVTFLWFETARCFVGVSDRRKMFVVEQEDFWKRFGEASR